MSVRSFLISKAVAEYADIGSMKRRGQFVGVTDVRFGFNDAKFRMYRVTSSIPMMVFLCDLLQEEAKTATGEMLIAITKDVQTILDELGRPDHNGVMPDISQIR
jgi:hypothetical protein